MRAITGAAPVPVPAAHAGGDEAHMGAGQMVADLLDRFFGGGSSDLGLGAGAEAFRDLQAHLDDAFRLGTRQGLGVGIGHDEIDPDETGHDHVVDCIAARAADAAYHDAGLQFPELRRFQIDRHRLASRWFRPLASAMVFTDKTAARRPPTIRNCPSASG